MALYSSATVDQAADHAPDNSYSSIESTALQLGSQEPAYGGWSLNIDNDLLTGGDLDGDYTGGIAIAVTGAATREWLFSLDNARNAFACLSHFDHLYKNEPQLPRHSIELGFTLFTSSDLSIAEPIKADHPYASLFFVANAAQHVLSQRKLSCQSVLTFGALGLSLAESVQGANLKYRLYNAILQGQFRDSVVTFNRDQLSPLIGEVWAGVLTELGRGYRTGMFLRARSAEIDKSMARNPAWGGFLISRSL